MNKLRAWLLEWPVQPLALAQCEVIEVVEEPEIHRIPVGPPWCRALVYWREQLLPLALSYDSEPKELWIVIVAYQPAPGSALEHGAIAVRGMPRQIDVPVDADCEPPADTVLRDAQLRACFLFEDRTIVSPELQALFAPATSACAGRATGTSRPCRS
jgi:chemotaxis signal transduction protein